MRTSIDDLKRKIQDKPRVASWHFPSWDFFYMRDIGKLERWIADFLQAFEEFETELREKSKEAQNDPARLIVVETLEEILGE